MIPLTYTISVEQQSLLRHIEMLRVSLLTIVLPPHIEQAHQWNARIHTIKSICGLAGESLPLAHIEHALELRSHPLKLGPYKRFAEALQTCSDHWVGSSTYRSIDGYNRLFTMISTGKPVYKTVWNEIASDLTQGISYITYGSENAVIQAAILSAIVLCREPKTDVSIRFGSLIAHAVLATHGLTCRDLVSPASGWEKEIESFTKAIESVHRDGNLNHWMLFLSLTLKRTMEDAITRVSTTSDERITQHAKRIATLTARQKAIMRALEKPGAMVNNRYVQQHFAVSQLTASRDLSSLMTLGLVIAHGKSRSTSYSRVY